MRNFSSRSRVDPVPDSDGIEGTIIMNTRKIAACAIVALTLGACEGQSTGETVGTLGGAAGGALLGSQFGSGTGQLATTAIGTLVGALAGRELAQRLEPNQQQQAVAAEETAIRNNETITWNDPQSNRGGEVQPLRTYTNASGQTCREYAHTVYIEGEAQTARGTACQQADGTWRVIS